MKMTTTSRQTALTVRIAWLATLVLATLLLGVKAAHAAPVPAAAVVPVLLEGELNAEEEEEEEEESEEGEEECLTAEEEFEAGEIDEAEVEEACEEGAERTSQKGATKGATAPEECVLRSARAVATLKRNKLKVTIGYTTYEPAGAMIEIRKGSTRIASVRRRLGRSGVLRITKKLSKRQRGKQITVRVRVPSAPRNCARYETHKLAAR